MATPAEGDYALRHPRAFGWGLMVLAAVVFYFSWILGKYSDFFFVSGSALVLALAVLTSAIAFKSKKYDVLLPALLILLNPIIMLGISFTFFFSEL